MSLIHRRSQPVRPSKYPRIELRRYFSVGASKGGRPFIFGAASALNVSATRNCVKRLGAATHPPKASR